MFRYTDFAGIIFDVDDTLLNNFPDGPAGTGLHERSRLTALHTVGKRRGIPGLQQITPAENHEGFLTAPVHSLESAVWNLMYGRGLVAVNSPDPTNEILREVIALKNKLHEKILREEGEEVPGASDFVRNLASHGFRDKMAIASTAVKRDIDLFLEKFALTESFPDARIISLHDVTHPKPHPQAFDLAFATLGLPAKAKDRVLVFEDDPRGIMAAKAAGMAVFAIATRYSKDKLAGLEIAPDFAADTFAEFSGALGLPATLKSMKYSFDGYNYLIRLDTGERLVESIEQFVSETKLEGVWLNGLGAVSEVTLRIYDLDKQEYRSKTFKEPMELASLTGNVAFDEGGKLVLHAHGVFGDGDYQAIGGHVQDFTTAATVELFIHRAYQPTKRKLDESVGLKTLDL